MKMVLDRAGAAGGGADKDCTSGARQGGVAGDEIRGIAKGEKALNAPSHKRGADDGSPSPPKERCVEQPLVRHEGLTCATLFTFILGAFLLTLDSPRAGVRVLWVLIDGVGDFALHSLGNKTPLQAASTPACDAIAASGVSGLMDPVQAGLACGSDTAHLSMFGYDPRTYYRGRGAFETMGTGLEMLPGDIAFKVRPPCPLLRAWSPHITKRRVWEGGFQQQERYACPW